MPTPPDDPHADRPDDEVDERQNDLAVANDCGPDAQNEPPGEPSD